jgi:protein-tyrosine phosphatase
MKVGIFFSLIAILFTITAFTHGGWLWLLLWPAISCGTIALGYFYLGPKVYGKSPQGLLSPLNQLLLLPYLLCLWSLWHLGRLVIPQPAFHQLTPNIFVGRRLLGAELPQNIDHVIDLTCEFNEPKVLRSAAYHSFQLLDASAPSPAQLNKWVEEVAAMSGTIYIHCAAGQGRAGMFATALALKLGLAQTPEAALNFVKGKRPLVLLTPGQKAVLSSLVV